MKKNLRDAILYYAIQYQGDWNKIAKAIKGNEPYKIVSVSSMYVTIVDEDYPVVFKQLRYPPWILFYKGNIQLCSLSCVGIVGSRNCSEVGMENTKIVVNGLKSRYCIVSGLAKGIDGIAHQSSLDAHTIGIIGCGIDRVYPYENKYLYEQMGLNHLILSEYPLNTPPMAYHFPWRNRLIACLSGTLIVIEAELKSGTMLTVNEALELSREVYCLPTVFNDTKYKGCNYLISQGANILLDESQLDFI